MPGIKISRLSITVEWIARSSSNIHGGGASPVYCYFYFGLFPSSSAWLLSLSSFYPCERPILPQCAVPPMRVTAVGWVPDPKRPITELAPLRPHWPPQSHFIDLTTLTTLGSFLSPSCQWHPIWGNWTELSRPFLALSLLQAEHRNEARNGNQKYLAFPHYFCLVFLFLLFSLLLNSLINPIAETFFLSG